MIRTPRVPINFMAGWAITSGQCAHLFQVRDERASALCGLKRPLSWLRYPDDRRRCVSCCRAIQRDQVPPV